MGPDDMTLAFLMLSFKPAFHSPLSPWSRLFSFCSLSAIRVGSPAYLRLLLFLLAILITACDSSSLAFCMTYSAYKLNKQGENPFLILKKSFVPCLVLIVASWSAYSFLRRQVRWSGIPISLRIFHRFFFFFLTHKVEGFNIVNEAEVDFFFFLEFPCFLYDSPDVDNVVSVSLLFLNPACTSRISWFTYCWSLVWKTLSITFLEYKMRETVWR